MLHSRLLKCFVLITLFYKTKNLRSLILAIIGGFEWLDWALVEKLLQKYISSFVAGPACHKNASTVWGHSWESAESPKLSFAEKTENIILKQNRDRYFLIWFDHYIGSVPNSVTMAGIKTMVCTENRRELQRKPNFWHGFVVLGHFIWAIWAVIEKFVYFF